MPPKYDYRCQNCKKEFVIEESYMNHKKRKIICPKCRSKNIKRVISSVPTVVYIGDGFTKKVEE